jgi:hypothetical protein
MPELYDERRTEPRFATAGRGRLAMAGRSFEAPLLDLSLNGLKLARPEGFEAAHGDRGRLELDVEGVPPFTADVQLVHAEADRIGLEFHDMSPADFTLLAGVIEQFQRGLRP